MARLTEEPMYVDIEFRPAPAPAPSSSAVRLRRCSTFFSWCCFLAAFLLVGVPVASASAEERSLPTAQKLRIERHKLPNGLRVVLNEDHSSPNVAICVTYDVGSRNEVEGRSGFAHLFEHLMFQGSRNVEKGGHFRAVAERGGRMNGTTNKERTDYFEVLPSSELAAGLWLEADRLKHLALSRENFENQRRVVQEEYRKRYSNRVFGMGAIRLAELAFQGNFAYQHPTIGEMEDLDQAKLEWARDFHRTYYTVNNAVLSIAGDFDPAVAMTLVEKYFGDARPNPNLPRFPTPERQVEQSSERFSVIVDDAAKTPAMFVGYEVPPRRTKQRYALELATQILTGGESGRLHQSLVLEKASALSVHSWISHDRGPGLFTLKLVVAPLSNVDTVTKWLDGELKRARLIGPSDAELHRAKARIALRHVRALQENRHRARELAEYEVFWGDASLINEKLDAFAAITKDDVRAAASEFLKDAQRTIVEAYPPGWVRDLGPPITTTTYIVKKGDTLNGIAKKHGTTSSAIAKENGINPRHPIHPGQRLLVTYGARPRAITKTHVVKKGDTLIGIAKKYGTTAKAIARENRLSTKKPIIPGQELNITLQVSSSKSKSKTKRSNKPKPKKKK